MNTETAFPRPRQECICDFQSCVVDRVAALLRDLAKEWKMPAAVVADEMFDSIVCVASTEGVDPKLLESEELAKALRRYERAERETDVFFAFFTEQMEEGSQFKRGQHPLGKALIRSLRKEEP